MSVLGLIALVLLALATICAVAPTTIAGGDWPVFFVPGVLCWALAGYVSTPLVARRRGW